MKVILTGATGFIGQAALIQCIDNEAITSIVILSRRLVRKDLSSNEKVKVVIVDDFLNLSDKIIQECAGAEGCIWCLGGLVGAFPDVETSRAVNIDYTLAAANAFAKTLASRMTEENKFRFVYTSGLLAEREEGQSLWFMKDSRVQKGEAERGLFEIAKQYDRVFEAFVGRPGRVIPATASWGTSILGCVIPTVQNDVLGAALLDVFLNGSDQKIMDNSALVTIGKKALKH